MTSNHANLRGDTVPQQTPAMRGTRGLRWSSRPRIRGTRSSRSRPFKTVGEAAKAYGLLLHMNGARLMNAVVEPRIDTAMPASQRGRGAVPLSAQYDEVAVGGGRHLWRRRAGNWKGRRMPSDMADMALSLLAMKDASTTHFHFVTTRYALSASMSNPLWTSRASRASRPWDLTRNGFVPVMGSGTIGARTPDGLRDQRGA